LAVSGIIAGDVNSVFLDSEGQGEMEAGRVTQMEQTRSLEIEVRRKWNVNTRIDFRDRISRREWKWLGITFNVTV
jgi:hypothetical protein